MSNPTASPLTLRQVHAALTLRVAALPDGVDRTVEMEGETCTSAIAEVEDAPDEDIVRLRLFEGERRTVGILTLLEGR